MKEIKEIANRNRLYIIEDNAHSFLSEKNNQLLGTFGDIGITSLRKIFPVPDGAILFINNEDLIQSETPKISSKGVIDPYNSLQYIFCLYHLLSNLGERYRFSLDKLDKFRKIHQHFSNYPDLQSMNCKAQMSMMSFKIVNNLDFNDIALKRRENYKIWLEEFHGKRGIKVVFKELPNGVVPQVFPVIVENPKEFVKKMADRGVLASHWPSLPQEVRNNSQYENANFLARHLITLPVHQNVKKYG